MNITNIRIDGYAEKIGVDKLPSISWNLTGKGEYSSQKSYQISLKDENKKIYKTEWINSSLHQGVKIPKVQLKSFCLYELQIAVENLAGEKAASEWICFVTGAVKAEDFEGKWIGNGTAKPFYARRTMQLNKKVKSAYAAVCGLGQFIFYINGKKVGNHELDPGWTNYDKKIQYVVFDVQKYLAEGENALGISVGNGFYLADKGERYFFEMPPASMKAFMPSNTNGYMPFGKMLPLKAMLIVRYEDGTEEAVVTDESWKVREGACTLANVYGSEIYDARRYPEHWNEPIFDDLHWNYAKVVETPNGKLSVQGQPPIVVKKTYEAVLIGAQDNGFLYDLGQNMSCMLELNVKGTAGQQVDLYVAEKLDEYGRIDQMAKNWDMINVCCSYILSGQAEGESWRQEFSYVGGRYIWVKGATPEEVVSLKGDYIISDSPVTGMFTCDNEKYNQVYQLITEAIDSNLKSVHTDCPSIEKTAWLEESHLLAPSIMFYRDVRDLWSKIFDDAVTDQYESDTKENGIAGEALYRGAGFLPPIAPSYGKLIVDTPMGNFWDLIVWSSFPILAAAWYYEYYESIEMIERYYDANCRYMDYLLEKVTADGFIAHGLGDWGNPQFGAQATANIETAYYYKDLMTMANFAELLGRVEDKERFLERAQKVCENYNKKLLVQNDSGKWCYKAWDHKDEVFCTQACQALPLYFGMTPESKKADVLTTLVDMVKGSGFVSGEVGLPSIFKVLETNGFSDLIWEKAMKEDDFSYYYFVKNGETALGEYWEDNPRSHNHDMMGSLLELFYSDIAGIKMMEPGFSKIRIEPKLMDGINEFQCIYNSVHGKIEICVKKDKILINIPAGVICDIDLNNLGIEKKTRVYAGEYAFGQNQQLTDER